MSSIQRSIVSQAHFRSDSLNSYFLDQPSGVYLGCCHGDVINWVNDVIVTVILISLQGQKRAEKQYSITSRESVISSRDSGMMSRDSVMTSRDSLMTSRDSVMTTRVSVMTSRDSVMPSRVSVMTSRDV